MHFKKDRKSIKEKQEYQRNNWKQSGVKQQNSTKKKAEKKQLF